MASVFPNSSDVKRTQEVHLTKYMTIDEKCAAGRRMESILCLCVYVCVLCCVYECVVLCVLFRLKSIDSANALIDPKSQLSFRDYNTHQKNSPFATLSYLGSAKQLFVIYKEYGAWENSRPKLCR